MLPFVVALVSTMVYKIVCGFVSLKPAETFLWLGHKCYFFVVALFPPIITFKNAT